MYMSGWHWLWGSLMMGLWVVLIAAVVYFAVKLALPSGKR
jgi:hypothetical protein